MIAFIDESKAKKYLLVLGLVEFQHLTRLRKFLVKNLLAGQRSVHFRKESARRRTQLLRMIVGLDIQVVVFKDKNGSSPSSRESLIRKVCENYQRLKIRELVFELDQSCLEDDIKLLNALRPDLSWDHRERNQEPMLWVADAVAWCVNRGGEWERMVRPMIVETIEC